jgi:hypothetical protein
MGVYFALRTHYGYPSGKYLRYFPEAATVLSWFQNHWRGIVEGDAQDYAKQLLGTHVYGFDSLFEEIAEHNIPAPKSVAELNELLQEHLYAEGEILVSAHAVQVLTDDDELELAYYFFDDEYVNKKGDKAAFLLQEAWQLPHAVEEKAKVSPRVAGLKTLPAAKGEGTTYCALLSFYDSASLSDIFGASQIRGVRLPALANYLASLPGSDETPYELQLLRALAAPEQASFGELLDQVAVLPLMDLSDKLYKASFGTHTPAEDAAILREAAAKHDPILQEGGNRSLIQQSPHVAQICLYVSSWGELLVYQRWIFFDDLWLNTYPALGKAILRFASRWDVLT